MAETLKTVRLYGTLGAKFGRVFRLAVASPAEAISALSVQIPGFRRFLNDASDKGLVFAVFAGKRNLSKDQVGDLTGDEEIRIAPVIEGSKRAGVFQVILGAVLIVASFVPGLQFLAPVGISMVLGGVVQLLSPQPKGLGAKDDPDNQPSYSFNGPVNTSAQGNPVPIAYGRTWCGSAIISAGILAQDQL